MTVIHPATDVELSNGKRMPALHFGVYQITDPKVCQKAVEDAFEVGYRAVDTAASYGNEAAVGAAIRASGLARDEVFVTTKLWVEDASKAGAERAVARSLEKLGLDRIDLYLLHQPFGDVYGAWRTMERLVDEGVLGSIGVSNFSPDRLVDFWYHQRIKPVVNQIEINPFRQQREALPILAQYGVRAEAWAPFGEGRNGLFTNPVLQSIARKHDRSVAQIVLRYVLELGALAVAKTVSPERMRENRALFDFALDEDDRTALAAFDTGKSLFFSHRDPAVVEWMCKRRLAL